MKALYILDEQELINSWKRYDYATTISGLGPSCTVKKISIESPDCRAQSVAADSGDVLKVFTLMEH